MMRLFGDWTRQVRAMAAAAALVASGMLASGSIAQTSPTDEKRALAIEITQAGLESINLDQLSLAALDQFVRNSPNKSEEFRQVLLSLAPIVRGEVEPMMSDITKVVARFYEERFEVDELKQLRTFVMSPVGRKQARLGSEFSARFAVTLQQSMAARAPAIEAKIKAELSKRGYKL